MNNWQNILMQCISLCYTVNALTETNYVQRTKEIEFPNGSNGIQFNNNDASINLSPKQIDFVKRTKNKKYYLNKNQIDSDLILGFEEVRSCHKDKDCGVQTGHVCHRNKCECHSNFIKYNATHCLPGVLLGFSCVNHSQCRLRVPDSSCIQGFCRCGAGKAPYRRANCISESRLGQSCRTHHQCSLGTEGSTCKWIVRNVLGRCQCKSGMPRRGNKCGPPGFALGAPCGKSFDCAQHVPGSICVGLEDDKTGAQHTVKLFTSRISDPKILHEITKYMNEESSILSLGGVCACPQGYLSIKNGSHCVPVKKDIGIAPVSIGKPCLFSSQCKASDPYTYCSDGVCECLVPTATCSSRNTGCHKETFQCISDGRCLSPNFVCDGHRDCTDGSDEMLCQPGSCSNLAFTCRDGSCIPRGKICDGKIDCIDGSDEAKCEALGGECPPTTFRCNNGQCLPGFVFCNAHPSCKDHSDENTSSCVGGAIRAPYCPFRCKNGRCRSSAIICSGKDGCGDNSDEENCSVCNCQKP